MNEAELKERLLYLERITAVAYLDANVSDERYNKIAATVTRAIADSRHFRLVIVPTPSGGVVCDIKMEDKL